MNKSVIKILLVVAIFGVLFYFARQYPLLHWLQSISNWISGLGLLGWALLILILAAGSLCLTPATPFVIIFAALFGFPFGMLGSLIGVGLGASCGFLIARRLFRKDIVNRLKNNSLFRAIDIALEKEGWKIILLLRLCPIPFGLANYLYGLTSVHFRPYLFTTLLGSLPSLALFSHLGSSSKSGLDALQSGKFDLHSPQAIVLGISLLATLVAITVVPIFAKKALVKYANVSLDDLNKKDEAVAKKQ